MELTQWLSRLRTRHGLGEDAGSSVGEGSGVAVSCSVGCRRGSDPALLWCRPASTAPIRPLAWETPYAAGAAQEMAKRPKKTKKQQKKPP